MLYLVVYLLNLFFSLPISLIREPIKGFQTSNTEMSLKINSRGFCLRIMFLAIGSSLGLKLALFRVLRVTYKLISSCVCLPS